MQLKGSPSVRLRPQQNDDEASPQQPLWSFNCIKLFLYCIFLHKFSSSVQPLKKLQTSENTIFYSIFMGLE